MNRVEWRRASYLMKEIFGTEVDMEEGFFRCPECDEPIYEGDYSHYSKCPVCGFDWFENVTDE